MEIQFSSVWAKDTVETVDKSWDQKRESWWVCCELYVWEKDIFIFTVHSYCFQGICLGWAPCQKYKKSFSNLALFHRRHAARRKTQQAANQTKHTKRQASRQEEKWRWLSRKPQIKHCEIRRPVLLLWRCTRTIKWGKISRWNGKISDKSPIKEIITGPKLGKKKKTQFGIYNYATEKYSYQL